MSRRGALVAAARFVGSAPPPPEDPLKQALLAYWPYTEASGPALDASGNGRTATLAGTTPPARVSDGAEGTVMSFGGAGYLDVGAPLIGPRATWAMVTRAAWTPTGPQVGFYGEGQANGSARLLVADEGWNTVALFFSSNSDSLNFYITGTGAGDGAYHTIVTQRLGPTSFEIWIDSTLRASTTTAGNIQPTSYTAATIGCVPRNNGRDSFFTGRQQMMALFNRALTSAEIAELGSTPRARLS